MRAWTAVGILGVAGVVGCASPGPPRPPSLRLPQPAKDLNVQREGADVLIRFTLPQRTTDDMPIQDAALRATVCRGGEAAACVPVAALTNVSLALDSRTTPAQRQVLWHDPLPAAEMVGTPRLLQYRVELRNGLGRSAGWSEPAYTAAGAAPAAVEDLRAEETRAGILLRWKPEPADASVEVLLRRQAVAQAAKVKPQTIWLKSNAAAGGETLDSSAQESTPYQYVAFRQTAEKVGSRTIDLRSAPSQPVAITWMNHFPPPAPAGLSAAPFEEGGKFAIDLVWQPVVEPGLKGYVVTRQIVDTRGTAAGDEETLGTVAVPAFHDGAAQRDVRYRYGVRAVSKNGVDGTSATVIADSQ